MRVGSITDSDTEGDRMIGSTAAKDMYHVIEDTLPLPGSSPCQSL